MNWYAKPHDDAFNSFSSGPQGLSSEQAKEHLEQYGPNSVGEEEGLNYLHVAVNQVKSPLIYILLIAGAVTLALGEYIDAGVIMAVILLNGIIGFIQECKAEQSVRSLQQMVNPKATVLRDGQEKEVDSRTLVPGDVVLLISGTMVPADMRIYHSTELRVDESMLTGESIPAVKEAKLLEGDNLSPGDQTNMAFMGTIAVNGRARGVVVGTGSDTLLGSIATTIRSAGRVTAPIQEKIERLARNIGILVLFAATGLFGLGILLGENIQDMFLTAVAAAVATVPEGLPIVVTIAMAVGVNRMVRHNAIIRKLPAVETLGSTTVICSDKTGTLTVNRMTVSRIFDGERDIAVSGIGYDPTGEFSIFSSNASGNDTTETLEPDENLLQILRVGLLCNESRLIQVEEDIEKGREAGWEVEGDPTEGALIVSARKAGLERKQQQEEWPMTAMLPFESERGYMATLHEHNGKRYLFVKGGHDRLIELCQQCNFQQGLKPDTIRHYAKEYADEGLRVLAFAVREMPDDTSEISDVDVSEGLVFIGLQGMIDPPRAEAVEAVGKCHEAGIRVVMITGDHADTAFAIARNLGLRTSGDTAVTGTQLSGMNDAQLTQTIKETSVFARIAPEDKFRIVNAFKDQGEIVAVTGDGVNDAPALKTAHIGVSMGKGGTDVAREASDMVLVDDNFSSIFHAVREGRIVFENLRKVIFFLLPTGLAAVWSILMTLLAGIPIPYVPAQLLWINLVTNGLQDVALAFEPGEKGVEKKPPRPTKEGIISRLLIERTLTVSLCIAAGVYFVFSHAVDTGYTLEKSRTMAMTTMVLFQFFQALNARSENRSLFRVNPFSNKFLFISMILALAAQIWVVYSPTLAWIFRTEPMSGSDWMLCFATATSVIVLVEADKFIRRRLAEK